MHAMHFTQTTNYDSTISIGYHHKLTHRALIQELDAARDLGKQSVVFAAANVQSWLHACAALPHDNGAAGNDLPAECFESQPLRVRVSPVS
jgi:hypothetical protein